MFADWGACDLFSSIYKGKFNPNRYFPELESDFRMHGKFTCSDSISITELTVGSINAYDVFNYYLMRDKFKNFLKSISSSKNKCSEKVLIGRYFNCFSDSNYTKSLQDLGTTEDNLGYLYIQMGKYPDAEEHLKKAKTIRTQLEESEQKKHLSELSWTCNNLGELYLRMYEADKKAKHLSAAITNYEKAVELRIELNVLFNNRYLDNLAWSYTGLWRCYLNNKDKKNADRCRKAALAIYDGLNDHNQYDNDIKVLNGGDPLSEPLNWVGNQSHFKPAKAAKAKTRRRSK